MLLYLDWSLSHEITIFLLTESRRVLENEAGSSSRHIVVTPMSTCTRSRAHLLTLSLNRPDVQSGAGEAGSMDGGCAPGEPAGAGRGRRAAAARQGGVGRRRMSGARAHSGGNQPRSAAAGRGNRARSGGDALGGWGGQSGRGPGLGASAAGLRMPGNPPAERDSGTLSGRGPASLFLCVHLPSRR